jgi:nitroimidazol reductase NimA-like FMN-containing flavoprotein (pyridoxamine 5'-phosphate oxidase superfamily)
MIYARDGDRVLLHGSVASRLLRHGAGSLPVCVTVTHLDGVVLARSAFHHSVNYRSVVIRGSAHRITDPDELTRGFATLVDHAVPGRSGVARPPDRGEVKQTTLLALPIEDAAVKVRTGGPIDDEADLDLPVWAGVIPLSLVPGPAEPDPGLAAGDFTPPEVVRLP